MLSVVSLFPHFVWVGILSSPEPLGSQGELIGWP